MAITLLVNLLNKFLWECPSGDLEERRRASDCWWITVFNFLNLSCFLPCSCFISHLHPSGSFSALSVRSNSRYLSFFSFFLITCLFFHNFTFAAILKSSLRFKTIPFSSTTKLFFSSLFQQAGITIIISILISKAFSLTQILFSSL